MDIGKLFGTNRTKETEGTWIDAGDGAQFLVARIANKRWQQVNRDLYRPHRATQRMGKLSQDVEDDINRKVMAQTILLDWKGVKVNGQDIPYSPEAAEKMFKEYPDFLEFIAGHSMAISNFQDKEEADQQKNSLSA
jgi:hypothetical protein